MMKLGCAVTSYAATGPIVFKDGNLKKNFRTMQKYGFESVDLFIKKTSREQALEYKQMLNDHGISVATLFAIYLGEQGVKLSEPDPVKRAHNVDLVKKELEHAVTLGAVGLGMGYIRGCHGENETEADALKRIAEALKILGEHAKSLGTTILLEPINRYEINTLNRAVDTADFIRNNQLDGITMQPDMFHMNIEDKSLPEALRYAGDLVGNVHISSTNRYAVGEGHFNFKEVIDALHEIGYNGSLTLEAFVGDPEQALKQTADYLRPYLQ